MFSFSSSLTSLKDLVTSVFVPFVCLRASCIKMDGPNETFVRVECFPVEVWGSLSSFLPGEQILRFKVTGAKKLWKKLSSLHVVKSVILGFDFITFKCWPSALNELNSITELDLDFNKCRDSDWKPKLYMIPTCLRKLGIKMKSFVPSLCAINDSVVTSQTCTAIEKAGFRTIRPVRGSSIPP